ncbi:hypothetical protein LTR97_002861 [Elasticomyces elasticus]|uniref:Uncharacterized protein n=1 Tax=Elasticomyces elasticus TaxID=574655 RepID=A0AAN7VV19_9PEZI|nr:hypothetical protein LTR97_002861 [Elasticomyces elasticus]
MAHNGQQGARAADDVKGVVKGFSNATEGLRQNINSFADNLVDKNYSSSTHTTHTTTGSGDIHPDAKKAGQVLERGVNSAEHKLDGTASGRRSAAH